MVRHLQAKAGHAGDTRGVSTRLEGSGSHTKGTFRNIRGLNGDFLSWQVTGWEGKGWVWEPMWVPRARAPWVVSGSAW